MKTRVSKSRRLGAICRDCDHDLEVRATGDHVQHPQHGTVIKGTSDGEVYCSNPSCQYTAKPHKLGSDISRGAA